MALREETLVRIQWGWFAFLTSEWTLAAVFLIITISRTRDLGTHVLKSSALATLLGLGHDTHNLVRSDSGLKELTMEATQVRVQLVGRQIVAAKTMDEALSPA